MLEHKTGGDNPRMRGSSGCFLALLLLGWLGARPAAAQLSPGEAEDADAERRKILKAADQVDRMDAAVEEMKSRLSSLEKILDDVKQQSNSLKESMANTAAKAEKEKETLLEEVAKMLAEMKTKEKKAESAPKPAERDGYEHTVAKGDTLSSIVQAYNKEYGLKLTVDSVRKANQLPKDAPLKVGQKIIIPST